MGERLDRYELVERVAKGGMGEVFLAQQHGAHGFSRPVIIKRILPHLVKQDGAVELFLHEARLGALLQHPNITQVLDLGNVDGQLFLAMELVEGPDLRTLQRAVSERRERMPFPISAYIVARAADGVAFAHAAADPRTGRPLRLVHRDISPQNLLLSKLGDVKLTDFGIAKSAARLLETQAGFTRGKLGYMSPEQLSHQRLTPRTDVYSLGVVLYELLIGGRLYPRMAEADIMHAKLSATPPPPSTRNPAVDEALDAIVLRAVAKEPGARYATAAALSESLDRWARGSASPPDKRALTSWLAENARGLGVTRVQPPVFDAAVVTGQPDATASLPAYVDGTEAESTAVSIDLSSDFGIAPPAGQHVASTGAPLDAEEQTVQEVPRDVIAQLRREARNESGVWSGGPEAANPQTIKTPALREDDE